MIDFFSLFVEMKVLYLLRIAALLVPVADQCFRLVLTWVVGSLLYDEVPVHLEVTIIIIWNNTHYRCYAGK